MITRTEAIKRFLIKYTKEDLAALYNHDMECQVNVAQDGGERVEGEFQGRRWHGWSDGLGQTWKSFRIPFKASTEPEYTDRDMSFDLEAHAEAIGMTGWNWKLKQSHWVAFDFDAITGHTDTHQKKLTQEELNQVQIEATNIPWVTVRKSTSGKGLHLYVHLIPVETKTHTEHAALARAILGMMSAITGYDFSARVDACGGNIWIWHRKSKGTDGLTLIKHGEYLTDIPTNWRDHIPVTAGKRRRTLPQNIEEKGLESSFEELCGQRPRVALDSEHKRLIEYLRSTDAMWWWDSDNHMLVTHTVHLKEAHDALGLRGFFHTIATGKEKGQDHNCFGFPLRKGAWAIRRYTPGVAEHDSWDQDGNGWTRTYLNREPDLAIASRINSGIEDPSGGFVFQEAEQAQKAALMLGVDLKIAPALASRQTTLKVHPKDGRLIVQIPHQQLDKPEWLEGWLLKSKNWIRIFNQHIIQPSEADIGYYDDVVRHVIAESGSDGTWMIFTDSMWHPKSRVHIKDALGSLGFSPKEQTSILGSSIFRAWKLVNKPFQPEYPGDREWNRNAAQLRFTPTQEVENLQYPTWNKILNHCGESLNNAVRSNPWCKANGIITGADYLKCWVAALFQHPDWPLPYLFLYGPQNSGKSIFHEALGRLITKGYQRADQALSDKTDFNGELSNAIICVVEETDLRRNKTAYDRIKDWVTSKELLIHAKRETPYHIRNTTHWIQCANYHTYCPLFPGDTRITMSFVDNLDPIDLIPKHRIEILLDKEAPDFLAAVLGLELPESNDRLTIPVLATDEKKLVEAMNRSDLEIFVAEKCKKMSGNLIKFSEFWDRFTEWLDPSSLGHWSKIKMGRELPLEYPKGRIRNQAGQYYIGNIAWVEDDVKPSDKIALFGEYLEPVKS